MRVEDAVWIKEVFYPNYYMTTLNSKTMVGYYQAEMLLLGLDKPNVRGCNCHWRHVGKIVHALLDENKQTINQLYEQSQTPQPQKRGRKKKSI